MSARSIVIGQSLSISSALAGIANRESESSEDRDDPKAKLTLSRRLDIEIIHGFDSSANSAGRAGLRPLQNLQFGIAGPAPRIRREEETGKVCDKSANSAIRASAFAFYRDRTRP